MTAPRLHLLSAALCASVALTGCASWFSGDGRPQPTPLTTLSQSQNPELLWRVDVAKNSAEGVFQPAVIADRVWVSSENGEVLELDSDSGRVIQRLTLKQDLAAGIAANADHFYVITKQAKLMAHLRADGSARWTVTLSSLPTSPAQVAGDKVIVQTQDGRVSAFDSRDGRQLWVYQHNLPALTVRHSGSLQALGGEVALLGMSGGRLGVLNLASGELIWESAVTLPRGATELERIADVASPPVFDGNMVCAVAFQGRVACLDAKSGTPLWSRELSSSRGLTFDARLLYVTADDGTVHAFDRYSGTPMWKQEGLRYRGVSAPALLNGQVLVYDAEGYAHLLSSLDGSLVGRLATGGNELQGRPLNVSAQRVLLQTENGRILALGR